MAWLNEWLNFLTIKLPQVLPLHTAIRCAIGKRLVIWGLVNTKTMVGPIQGMYQLGTMIGNNQSISIKLLAIFRYIWGALVRWVQQILLFLHYLCCESALVFRINGAWLAHSAIIGRSTSFLTIHSETLFQITFQGYDGTHHLDWAVVISRAGFIEIHNIHALAYPKLGIKRAPVLDIAIACLSADLLNW
jgi:hypothetical protein